MKVVITGGAGFLGQRLAARILEMGALTAPSGETAAVDELLLFDQQVPDDLADDWAARWPRWRVTFRTGPRSKA